MSDRNIHDHFVKSILSNRTVAIDYFKTCIPENVQQQLDLTTITRLPETYLSEKLRETMSDIVYSCNTSDGNKAKITLLVEHKSYYDRFTPVQMCCYLSAALQQVENDKQLSVIIPILLYHGKQKYEYKTVAQLFANPSTALKPFLPDFQYVFHDLGAISDEEVKALNNRFLAASLLAMKHTFDKEWLTAHIAQLFVYGNGVHIRLQKGLYKYLIHCSEISETEIQEIFRTLPEDVKTNVMTTAQMFIEKGKSEGIAIGKNEGIAIGQARLNAEKANISKALKLKGMPPDQISEITGLSAGEIQKL